MVNNFFDFWENVVDLLVMGKVAFLWICWCFLHSFLISHFFTRQMRALLDSRFAWYRIFFNVISFVTLVPVVVYQFSLKLNNSSRFVLLSCLSFCHLLLIVGVGCGIHGTRVALLWLLLADL